MVQLTDTYAHLAHLTQPARQACTASASVRASARDQAPRTASLHCASMAGDSGLVQLPPSPAANPNHPGKGGGSALSQPIGNWDFSPNGRYGWQVPGRPSTPERFVCRCMPPRTPAAQSTVSIRSRVARRRVYRGAPSRIDSCCSLQEEGRGKADALRLPQRNYTPIRCGRILSLLVLLLVLLHRACVSSNSLPFFQQIQHFPNSDAIKWPCWARRWFLSGFLSPRRLVSFGVPVDSPHIHFLLAQGLHFRILFVTLRLPTYLLVGTDDVPDNYRRAPQRHMRLPTRASRPQRP